MLDGSQVVIIKPQATSASRQGLPQFFGVSGATTGAKNISMNVTAFAPGGRAKVHYHRDYETAIYGVSGRIALYHGANLETCSLIEPGCFCFIPAYLPHVAFNLSDDEPAVAITARNDAAEQENVVMSPDLEPRAAEVIAKHKAALG